MRFEYSDARMPFAMIKNGSTYYLAYDQVGTLRVAADELGNVAKQIDYDSFGNVIHDSNPSFYVPFGFAGGLYDRDTGLLRFGYRDYDPDVGRWTSKDPILFAGGDTDVYGYALCNPVTFSDPAGLACGPGKIGDWIIPDFPGGYNFNECCKEHDKCYEEERKAPCPSKEKCDTAFRDCMMSYCDTFHPWDGQCTSKALMYWSAVVLFGENSFNGSGR